VLVENVDVGDSAVSIVGTGVVVEAPEVIPVELIEVPSNVEVTSKLEVEVEDPRLKLLLLGAGADSLPV
jgi:hypothetical protein